MLRLRITKSTCYCLIMALAAIASSPAVAEISGPGTWFSVPGCQGTGVLFLTNPPSEARSYTLSTAPDSCREVETVVATGTSSTTRLLPPVTNLGNLSPPPGTVGGPTAANRHQTKESCRTAGGAWLPLNSSCTFAARTICQIRGGTLINNRLPYWWCDVNQKSACKKTGGMWFNDSFGSSDQLGWCEYDYEILGYCHILYDEGRRSTRLPDYRQGKCQAHMGQWEPLS